MTNLDTTPVTRYVPEDDYFGAPFIDVDEWRAAPHRHRFVHGGFTGTETRFSFYFPPDERYRGRFLSALEGGVGGHETRAADLQGDRLGSIGFAFANGAYLVESNNGHIAVGPATSRGAQHGSITTFRATAESARFARHVAYAIYGERPHHGYIFGPSGGGWRTILCMENTRGIWDGAVPYISPAGNGMSFPCAVGNLARVLGSDLRRVVDAWEPGGSGAPFTGLSTRQRQELATLYRAGMQPGAEAQLLTPAFELGVLLLTSRMTADHDQRYFSEFWEATGYAGADGELDGELIDDVVRVTALVSAGELVAQSSSALDAVAPDARTVDPATPVALRVSGGEISRARGADVVVREGVAAGRTHKCLGILADTLVLDFARTPLAGIACGDLLRLDNHDYLAYCHAYRHQIDLSSPDCAQFVNGGVPIFPQRPVGVPDALAGVPTTGRFDGRMIYLSNLTDTLASPVGGTVTYMGRVREQMGDEASDRLRVWLNENAGHVIPSRRPAGPPPVTETRIIDYEGSVEHAVRAMIDWVEEDIEPPPDTRFAYDDGRITLAPTAAARRGIQPAVVASVDGGTTVRAAVGQPVRLEVRAEAPPGAGRIIAAEWDFEGRGTWPHRHDVDGCSHRLTAAVNHAYAEPGIYFPCVRVASHGAGDTAAPDGRVLNLARLKVEVSATTG
jgi:hypothetical protein